MSVGGVMRKAFLGMCVLGTLAFAQVSFAQETAKKELREHPRIAAAIRELHGAIEYMERAPHDFGGHKAQAIADRDRKSTRLNSSHSQISYAVFCLKKKRCTGRASVSIRSLCRVSCLTRYLLTIAKKARPIAV